MKNLIFTADDYGAYEEIDNGILSALNEGWLNSVAMFANGSDMQTSADKILPYQKASKVDIGCHFTFNSGKALSKAMQDNNDFTHKGYFRPYFNMNIGRILRKSRLEKNLLDLKEEIMAQIDALTDLKIDVKHLSSHFNTLHYYPAFLDAQFQVLALPKYEHIKLRSVNIKPKMSNWFLPLGARVATVFQGEIEVPQKGLEIVDHTDAAKHVDAIIKYVKKCQKERRVPNMPDVLDGFHYQKVGSLGIGRSTKRRKAKRKSTKILEKVLEAYDSTENIEYVFHLADPVFMGKNHHDKKKFKRDLENKYAGITPKYMDNRHVEYQSLENFSKIAELNLDPQPWSKI